MRGRGAADGKRPHNTIRRQRGADEAGETRVPRGGSVVWDGRDQSGRLVPSGMYLVVAVGQDGEGAAYGKVAVIR